jgi:hypothetical protein
VGVTPGPTQPLESYRVIREHYARDAPLEHALAAVKANASSRGCGRSWDAGSRGAHAGDAHFVRGVVGAFRNPDSAEPKVEFSLTEKDALDMLATISMVHRRLDQATVTPAAPACAAARLAAS